jgi:eukaryotic sulfide quinone oxidoreductase
MGQKKNTNFIYNTAHPDIFEVKHYADALWKLVEDRKIVVNLRRNLIEILPDKNQAIFENLDDPEEIYTTDYEFLHVTPTMSAPDVVLKNEDLVSACGFLNVSEDTMQHNKFENIFGIGDCSVNSKTMITAPLSMLIIDCRAKQSQIFSFLFFHFSGSISKSLQQFIR